MIHISALNLRRDYCFQWERVVAGDEAPGMESGCLTELKVKKAQQAPRDRGDVNGGSVPFLVPQSLWLEQGSSSVLCTGGQIHF